MIQPIQKIMKAKQIATIINYQKTKDSPTIKYYTKWNKYQKHMLQETIPENKAEPKHKGILPEKTPTIKIITPTHIQLENNHQNTITKIIQPEDNTEKEVLSLYDPSEGKLLAQHIGELKKILYIKIPKNTSATRKIFFTPPKQGHHPYHVTIILEQESQATIELIQAEKIHSGLNTITLEIIQLEKSKLNLINQLLPQRTNPLYSIIRIEKQAETQTKVNTIVKAGEMTHSRIEVIAKGEKADTNIKSIIIAEDDTIIDHITTAVNDARDTTAEIRATGFNLGGELTHQGTVKATVKGRNSINKLYSNIIPLSEKGVNVSVPKLEIDIDDVIEGVHSSDISSPSPEALFYLQSRGLTNREAIMLMLQSSIQDTLEYSKEMPYEKLENYATEIISDLSLNNIKPIV